MSEIFKFFILFVFITGAASNESKSLILNISRNYCEYEKVETELWTELFKHFHAKYNKQNLNTLVYSKHKEYLDNSRNDTIDSENCINKCSQLEKFNKISYGLKIYVGNFRFLINNFNHENVNSAYAIQTIAGKNDFIVKEVYRYLFELNNSTTHIKFIPKLCPTLSEHTFFKILHTRIDKALLDTYILSQFSSMLKAIHQGGISIYTPVDRRQLFSTLKKEIDDNFHDIQNSTSTVLRAHGGKRSSFETISFLNYIVEHQNNLEKGCTLYAIYKNNTQNDIEKSCNGRLYDCTPNTTDSCHCICEKDDENSNRYFSLREVNSTVDENKVVVGVRFVKKNHIFHIQIREGEINSFGIVSKETVKWKPVDNFTIHDEGIVLQKDYYKLTYLNRTIRLNTVQETEPYVVTGVGLKYIGNEMFIEVRFHEFNTNGGKILSKELWTSKLDDDVPTIKFDIQNGTIGMTPFIDTEKVISLPFVPLSGIGMYNRTGSIRNYIALKAFSYKTYN